jgi:histidinol phosphatase-like PHP family hydrolase
MFSIDHDYHIHTHLSTCSGDPEQTVENITRFARQNGMHTICITDHLWDDSVPGASAWYRPQNIAHIQQSLPLPKGENPRVLFGCETEYLGGTKLGLSPEHFDLFDFIIVPLNHFHMVDFVRPSSYDTPEKIADLLLTRMEEVAKLPLPWHKIGIAHPTCSLVFREGNEADVYRAMDPERLASAMKTFADKGAGIELNSSSFSGNWRQHENEHLKIYRAARDTGCKFYCGSDSHKPKALSRTFRNLPVVIELLGLKDEHVFHIA